MDVTAIWNFINSGISSEALGGVAGAGILATINKIKSYFNDKDSLTETELINLYKSNDEFRKEIALLLEQLEANSVQIKGKVIQIGHNNTNITGSIIGNINFE